MHFLILSAIEENFKLAYIENYKLVLTRKRNNLNIKKYKCTSETKFNFISIAYRFKLKISFQLNL